MGASWKWKYLRTTCGSGKGRQRCSARACLWACPFPMWQVGPGQGLPALASRTLSSLQKQRERQPELGLLTLNPSVRTRVWPAAQHPLTHQRTGSGQWHMAMLRVSLHVPCRSLHSLATSRQFIPWVHLHSSSLTGTGVCSRDAGE